MQIDALGLQTADKKSQTYLTGTDGLAHVALFVWNPSTPAWEKYTPAAAGGQSSTVSVDNFPAVQAVSVDNLPAIQPVSGTVSVSNLPATQPVSGPLTDTQLRANAVPVSGTFWQATQPVSGPLTDTQLRASAVTVSGPLTDTQLRASAVPVSGSLSLGSSTGKTLVMKTGTLASVAATADQVILTYTVTAGKTFYLQYLTIVARLTTYAATATNFGDASLESPAATKLFTQMIANAGAPDISGWNFAEPVAIPAGTVIRVVCTPSAATAFTWRANLGGYEK
jgi:hypothetical protein